MGFDFAALERRIGALEANRGASLRFGTVTEVTASDGSARVQLPDGGDMVSLPLRLLQKRTLKDKMQCFPDAGEQVAVLFSGQGLEQGVVLGAVYSKADASPDRPAQMDSTIYEDGAIIEYDRKEHEYVIAVPAGGSIVFRIGGSTLKMTENGIKLTATRIDLN